MLAVLIVIVLVLVIIAFVIVIIVKLRTGSSRVRKTRGKETTPLIESEGVWMGRIEFLCVYMSVHSLLQMNALLSSHIMLLSSTSRTRPSFTPFFSLCAKHGVRNTQFNLLPELLMKILPSLSFACTAVPAAASSLPIVRYSREHRMSLHCRRVVICE